MTVNQLNGEEDSVRRVLGPYRVNFAQFICRDSDRKGIAVIVK